MDSAERRKRIVQILTNAKGAVTGTELSQQCDVSRQIIVGDVAILRAEGLGIVSTPRGYQLIGDILPGVQHVFVCCHDMELMQAELEAIVDNGGVVHNVVIEHEVYGNLEGTLNLRSRRDVKQYVKKMKDSQAELLSRISGGIHTHLVTAACQEDIDAIQEAGRHRRHSGSIRIAGRFIYIKRYRKLSTYIRWLRHWKSNLVRYRRLPVLHICEKGIDKRLKRGYTKQAVAAGRRGRPDSRFA